ncbi:MAG: NAD regulator [Alphaproteobacteria bacterium]|nr:NAD regulator [Alphaproteobacteria bacterium]
MGTTEGLPFGPFSPFEHRTLEIGLRSWVNEQTGIDLGYVEQLYTFGDRGRQAQPSDTNPHVVSIGYLALTRAGAIDDLRAGSWRSWYHYFPWEDWRAGRPEVIDAVIAPALNKWANEAMSRPSREHPLERNQRVGICFGLDGATWDEEKVLERYELLYEAGLVTEARRDRPESTASNGVANEAIGAPMRFDHRRVLATAIGRVRAKIKYRPVIFELMQEEFTLFELQKHVEAILGPHLHKQNFRRLVESAGLVEPTGEVKTRTGGRPAKLFRFRREVMLERPAPGVRIKLGRA